MTMGYVGKILRINLTKRTTSALDTEQYGEYGGGNGMGTALFWDFCKDKTVSGFHPDNVVTVTTSPLTGTLAPGSGRLEICGINVFSYPVEWFSRSNIGGFFGTMLKSAGWDGIVIEGKADSPVWINIIDDKVTIEDATDLWGQDIIVSQDKIWNHVTGRDGFGQWLSLGERQTTQGPSVLCIGRGGESLSRMGTVQSGIGMAAGQGGFGAVWGSKNLKAISAIGTGSIRIADPKALMAARDWLRDVFEEKPVDMETGRQTSCSGCFQKCKSRSQGGAHHDSQCLDSIYETDVLPGGRSGSDIIQIYGLNLNDLTGVPFTDGVYLHILYQDGVLGPGKAIDTSPLPMEKFGGAEYATALCEAIVSRTGIGADLAEGLLRAAEKWGRLEDDLSSGKLRKSQWGYGWHWNLPFVEQGYGSLMGDRDITEHLLSSARGLHFLGSLDERNIGPDELVEMLSQKIIPYTDDPFMFDFSWQENDGSNMKQALETGIYSEHKAKLVSWHRHYTRFWAESALYCDLIWPVLFNDNSMPEYGSYALESEPRFFNAVTGRDLTFKDGIRIGRKIWNMNRAIWVLQGRQRDMEHFADFMYTPNGCLDRCLPGFPDEVKPKLPIYEKGKWGMRSLSDMYLDRDGVEQWKTHFYGLEGWDPATGWPTRDTLEELDLQEVADSLAGAGRLGNST